MSDEIARTLGRHLPFHAGREKHPAGLHNCPACGIDLRRVAIVDLAYVFERCMCPVVDYVHLVEQLWHRACFLVSGKDNADG